MEIDHYGIDVICGSAVVIYHTDLRNGLQKGLALHLIRPVGVYNDQCAVVVTADQCFLSGNEDILIFRHFQNFRKKFFGHVPFLIQNDIGFFAFFAAHTADTHSSAQRIQIRILVTHDEDLTALTDKLH